MTDHNFSHVASSLKLFYDVTEGANERVSVNDNGDGTYSCYYTPTKPGDYVIAVTYSGRDAGASPYRVSCVIKIKQDIYKV